MFNNSTTGVIKFLYVDYEFICILYVIIDALTCLIPSMYITFNGAILIRIMKQEFIYSFILSMLNSKFEILFVSQQLKRLRNLKAWDGSHSARFTLIYGTGEYKLVHLTETRSLGVLTEQVQSVNLYHFFHFIVHGMSFESLSQRGGTK